MCRGLLFVVCSLRLVRCWLLAACDRFGFVVVVCLALVVVVVVLVVILVRCVLCVRCVSLVVGRRCFCLL